MQVRVLLEAHTNFSMKEELKTGDLVIFKENVVLSKKDKKKVYIVSHLDHTVEDWIYLFEIKGVPIQKSLLKKIS